MRGIDNDIFAEPDGHPVGQLGEREAHDQEQEETNHERLGIAQLLGPRPDAAHHRGAGEREPQQEHRGLCEFGKESAGLVCSERQNDRYQFRDQQDDEDRAGGAEVGQKCLRIFTVGFRC